MIVSALFIFVCATLAAFVASSNHRQSTFWSIFLAAMAVSIGIRIAS